MIGAWKFGRPKAIDWVILVSSIAWTGLIFTAARPYEVYMGFCVGLLIPMLLQLREQFETKVRGVLKIEWMLMNLVKNAVLTIFGLASGDVAYSVFAPIYFLVTAAQIVLWIKYGKPVARLATA